MGLGGRTVGLGIGLLVLSACDGGGSVRVTMDLPTVARLDPTRPESGVQRFRIRVQGPNRFDQVLEDVPVDEPLDRTVEGLAGDLVSVEILGLDEEGNLRAFGRVPLVSLDGMAQVPVRRALAYVVHRPNVGLSRPDGVIYVFDLASRTLLERIALPEPIRATGISPWGGRAMLIPFNAGLGEGGVGLLYTADHRFERIDLGFVPDLVLAAPSVSSAVAVDASRTVYLDLESGEVVGEGRPIGGSPVDGVIAEDGRRAVVVMDAPPFVVDFDLQLQTEQTFSLPQTQPGGVGLDRQQNLAYVVGASGPVAAIDLVGGAARAFDRGFNAPVNLATYSPFFNGVVAVRTQGVGQIRSFSTLAEGERGEPIDTFDRVTGITTDGAGRRVIVVGAGTSTLTSGITVLDTRFDRAPEATSTLYPQDPEEVDASGRPVRYQPAGVAVPFGN